jgi:hypothetical protein
MKRFRGISSHFVALGLSRKDVTANLFAVERKYPYELASSGVTVEEKILAPEQKRRNSMVCLK